MLIVLDSTTRKLQAKMSMAAMDLNCSVTCTYGDSTSSTFVEGIYPSTLNGTTLVDILPAPAASTRRVVKSIILFNDDTDTHTITLYLADGAASYPITKVTLAPGASWASDDQSGINIGGAVTDGSKGDINVSGGGTTWTIATGAVSTSKMGGDITAAGKALLDDANASAQRTTLGLGSIATQNSSSVSITGGSIAGITDLAIADGGTGQSTRQSAMDALAGSVTNGQFLRGDGANVLMAAIKASDVPTLNQNTTGTASNVTGTVAVVNGGTGATTASDARTNLGLGTIATQSSASVSITGGSIAGITDLAVADGGTGASTAANALTNLGAYPASNPSGYTSNTGTVTSVGGTGTVNGITLTGSVTTSGNLTLGGTLSNVSLTSQVTGTLPIANGGTGLTATPTNGQIDIGNGTGFARTTLTAGSNITITNGAGTITIASTSSGVTDTDKGDIVVSGGGTVWTIDSAVVSNAKLATMNANTIKARVAGSTGAPEDATLTQVLDLTGGSAQGSILYRGASTWTTLAPGTTGQFLRTNGFAGNPEWNTIPTYDVTGTNTGDQNVFSVVAVAGQSNIVADTTSDTLTIAAGSNITITTNATSDTLTIASTAAGVTNGDKGDIVVSGSGDVWTIDSGVVSNAKLATMNASTIKARITGSTGAPEDATMTQVLDLTGGSAQGSILYRGASTWTALAPGTSGQLLQTQGAGANPAWAGLTVGTSAISNGSSGRVLYNNSGVLGELGTTGSGNVVLATGANVVNLVLSGTLSASGGIGTSGQVLQSTGSGVQWAAGGGGGVSANFLINADFAVSQRGTSFTNSTTNNATPNTDGNYLLDRWVLLSNGNNIVNVTQGSASTNTLNIATDVTFTAVSAQKFGFFQPIENINCRSLRSTTVTFSFYAQVSNTRMGNIKAAIVQWTGTTDSITRDIVSAWDTEGTNPTLVTSWSYVNSSPTDLGVTTSWVRYSVTGTISASANNIGVFIWCDDTTFDASDTLTIAAAKLETGTTPTSFEALDYASNIAQCQRYYYRRVADRIDDVICMITIYSITSGGVWGTLVNMPVELRIGNPTCRYSSVTHMSIVSITGTARFAITSGGSLSGSKRSLTAFGGLTSSSFINAANYANGMALFIVFNTASGWFDAAAEL
jgi:hypothetical protein